MRGILIKKKRIPDLLEVPSGWRRSAAEDMRRKGAKLEILQCHEVFFPETVIAFFGHADERDGRSGEDIEREVGKR